MRIPRASFAIIFSGMITTGLFLLMIGLIYSDDKPLDVTETPPISFGPVEPPKEIEPTPRQIIEFILEQA